MQINWQQIRSNLSQRSKAILKSCGSACVSLARSLGQMLEAWWKTLPEIWRERVLFSLVIGLLILYLTLCAGCAANPPAAPPTQPCHAPGAVLLPTPEPPMSDATDSDLVVEAQDLRNALRACNFNKKQVADYFKERENAPNPAIR